MVTVLNPFKTIETGFVDGPFTISKTKVVMPYWAAWLVVRTQEGKRLPRLLYVPFWKLIQASGAHMVTQVR